MAVDPRSLRIVYMGTPDFAVAPLRALVEGGYRVAAVVTMPDKPAGRGLKLQESAVKRYAAAAGLPVLQPTDLRSHEFTEALRAVNPDLGIVVAFRMLPRTVFSMPRYGTFNLHASLLPQYRGAAPVNWAIINGEKSTGVTTFFLNQRMDEGALIDSRSVPIEDGDNAGTMHDKLMETGAKLVLESIDRIVSEGFHAVDQPEVAGSEIKAAPKIFKETGHLDFSSSGTDIVNLVRGLSPYPGAWANLKEVSATDGSVIRESALKIYSAKFQPDGNIADAEGSVIIEGNVMRVVCGGGYILPEQLQPEGKRRMDISEYLNGLKLKGVPEFG